MRIILSLCLMLLSVQAMAEESAYDRVMRTNEIRCGYGIYAPWIQKDLVTGEIKGVMADVAEAVAKQLDMLGRRNRVGESAHFSSQRTCGCLVFNALERP